MNNTLEKPRDLDRPQVIWIGHRIRFGHRSQTDDMFLTI